jgi:hypothetical protein
MKRPKAKHVNVPALWRGVSETSFQESKAEKFLLALNKLAISMAV